MGRRLLSLVAIAAVMTACSAAGHSPAQSMPAGSDGAARATAAVDAGWTPLAYPGSGFLAKFPGQPNMTKAKVGYMLDGGMTDGIEWNDPENGVVFSAGFSEWATLVPGVDNSSALFKTFTTGYGTRAPDPNRLESHKPVSVNGHDGVEYVWIGGDDTRFRMWAFVIGNRAYAVMATFPSTLQYSMAPQMDAFFADFYLV